MKIVKSQANKSKRGKNIMRKIMKTKIIIINTIKIKESRV
jgi:hypothetical protein